MRSNEASLNVGVKSIFCVILSVVLLIAISSAGCISKQSQPTVSSDQLEIQNRYFFDYNGTSFLTGILVNKATQSLVNTNLQAEGFINDTVYEQGRAGPDTGIKSVILPNESSPFMIKMTPVVSQNSSTNTSVEKPQLSYRIEPQIKSISPLQPYPLSTINTKATAFNRSINVSGEVYNEGTENITSSIVAAVFYQENGTVLGLFTGSPQGDLGPKQTAAFQIDVQTSAFPIKPVRTEIYAYQLMG